ncbi:MAG: hypothetical protein MJ179_01995 [Treponema sp.]|nr:hypothetical protein [Treponema sp.]
MNIASVILLSLLAVSFALYITALIKDWKILLGITSFLFIPLCCTPVILSLNNFLPDAYNLRTYIIVAISLISVSELFIYFRFRKELAIPGEILYTLSFLMWINIYKSTFYVFRTTKLSLIIEVVVLLIILLGLFIYLGKLPLYKYLVKIFQLAGLGYLNYCGLVTIINTNKNYGYTLFIGAFLMIVEFVIYSVETTKPVKVNKKIQRLIRTSIITVAEFLITITGLLMISN